MNDHKGKEPFIIVKSYTVVQPDTMMIESLNTVIAKGAVLTPSWFISFTSRTFRFLFVQKPIKVKLFYIMYVFFSNNTRVSLPSFIVSKPTH